MRVIAPIILVALAIGTYKLVAPRALDKSAAANKNLRPRQIGWAALAAAMLIAAITSYFVLPAGADDNKEETAAELEARNANEHEKVKEAKACPDGVDDTADYFHEDGKAEPTNLSSAAPASINGIQDFWEHVVGSKPGQACHQTEYTIFHGVGLDPTTKLGDMFKQGDSAPECIEWTPILDTNPELRAKVLERITDNLKNLGSYKRKVIKPNEGFDYALVMTELPDGSLIPAIAPLELPEEGISVEVFNWVNGDLGTESARRVIFDATHGWYILTAPIDGIPPTQKVLIPSAEKKEDSQPPTSEPKDKSGDKDKGAKKGDKHKGDGKDGTDKAGGGSNNGDDKGKKGPGDGDCIGGCIGGGGDTPSDNCTGGCPPVTGPPTTGCGSCTHPTTTAPRTTTTRPPATTTTIKSTPPPPTTAPPTPDFCTLYPQFC